jgi:hypothetical protein
MRRVQDAAEATLPATLSKQEQQRRLGACQEITIACIQNAGSFRTLTCKDCIENKAY